MSTAECRWSQSFGSLEVGISVCPLLNLTPQGSALDYIICLAAIIEKQTTWETEYYELSMMHQLFQCFYMFLPWAMLILRLPMIWKISRYCGYCVGGFINLNLAATHATETAHLLRPSFLKVDPWHQRFRVASPYWFPDLKRGWSRFALKQFVIVCF